LVQALADKFMEDNSLAGSDAFAWATMAGIVHEYAAELSQLSAMWCVPAWAGLGRLAGWLPSWLGRPAAGLGWLG
jgi:hypothetical protein